MQSDKIFHEVYIFDGWMDDVILHAFQHYFSHIRKMGG